MKTIKCLLLISFGLACIAPQSFSTETTNTETTPLPKEIPQNSAINGQIEIAQKMLEFMQYNSNYTPQDYTKIVEWFSKIASQGNIKAQRILGLMYYNGLGVIKDYSKSIGWLSKAAKQGDAIAQETLGLMYYDGQGVNQDYTQAKDLLSTSL